MAENIHTSLYYCNSMYSNKTRRLQEEGGIQLTKLYVMLDDKSETREPNCRLLLGRKHTHLQDQFLDIHII